MTSFEDDSTPADSRPQLGAYLKEQRRLLGKSQRAIGGIALSSAYISQLEQGQIQDVKIATLVKIVHAYNIPLTSILSDVYGVEIEADDAEALAIGLAVKSLPNNRREFMEDYIAHQVRKQSE